MQTNWIIIFNGDGNDVDYSRQKVAGSIIETIIDGKFRKNSDMLML